MPDSSITFHVCRDQRLIRLGNFNQSRVHYEIHHNIFYFSLKKLYKLQSLFVSGPCIFYMPNLERNLSEFNGPKNSIGDNIIGSNSFAPSQCELNVIWHIIEEQQFATHVLNVSLKNMRYFLENSSVDMNSSVQVIFDVFTQLIEVYLHFSAKCVDEPMKEIFRFFFSFLRRIVHLYCLN